MAPPLLALQDIALTFGATPLLRSASLAVGEGDRLALVGRNGAGKSTLLRIAAGLIEADAGTRFLQPGATLRYLPQGADLAGFETTVNAIANGALALLDNPGEWEKVRREPALVKTMIEEMIRFDGPVQSFFRNTLVDSSVAGVNIRKGGKVMLLFASANRDESHYPGADQFRIDRQSPDHVGYGVGIHYCLGAPLARAQLAALFRRI